MFFVSIFCTNAAEPRDLAVEGDRVLQPRALALAREAHDALVVLEHAALRDPVADQLVRDDLGVRLDEARARPDLQLARGADAVARPVVAVGEALHLRAEQRLEVLLLGEVVEDLLDGLREVLVTKTRCMAREHIGIGEPGTVGEEMSSYAIVNPARARRLRRRPRRGPRGPLRSRPPRVPRPRDQPFPLRARRARRQRPLPPRAGGGLRHRLRLGTRPPRRRDPRHRPVGRRPRRPEVVRAFEAGPDGLDVIAVGGPKPPEGDGSTLRLALARRLTREDRDLPQVTRRSRTPAAARPRGRPRRARSPASDGCRPGGPRGR